MFHTLGNTPCEQVELLTLGYLCRLRMGMQVKGMDMLCHLYPQPWPSEQRQIKKEQNDWVGRTCVSFYCLFPLGLKQCTGFELASLRCIFFWATCCQCSPA